jgi:GAF domain-containing protein
VTPSPPTGLEPVFQDILAAATRFCGADAGCVLLHDGAAFEAAALCGVKPAYAAFLRRGPLPVGPNSGLTWVATERSALHIPDLAAEAAYQRNEPDWVAAVELEGARTALHVPMLRGDDFCGVLTMYRRVGRSFTQEHIALARAFAGQAVVASENVRLLGDVQSRDRELAEVLEERRAAIEILRVIAGSPTNLQPVLDTVAENAARVCGATDAVIMRVQGDALKLLAHHGPIPIKVAGEPLQPLSRGLAPGRAVLDRKTIHIADVAEADAAFPVSKDLGRRLGFRTVLAIPLLREGTPIGVIVIRRAEVQPFSDKHIELLETFADQAVIAIENVRLFNETNEALDHQRASAEVLQVISTSVADTRPVFDKILESCERLFEGHRVGITLVGEDGTVHLAAYHGPGRDDFKRHFPVPLSQDSGSGMAIAERRVIHYSDVEAPGVPEYARRGARLVGSRSVLFAPMLWEGRGIGAIFVSRPAVGEFSEKAIALLKTFADQAVIAIENVRLFKALEARNREITEALEQQTATSEVLQVISSSPTDATPVFETIVANAARLCEAKFAAALLYDGERLHAPAHTTVTAEFAEYFKKGFPVNRRTTAGRAALERRPVQIEDILSDPEFSMTPAHLSEGVRTVLAVPMLREDFLLGIITTWRVEVRPFTEQQIKLLQTFADQAVIAIENVRLFNELQARNRDLTEALEQQTATAEILRVISSSPTDLQPVLDAVVERAARLCGSHDAVIRSAEGDALRLVAHFGSLPDRPANDIHPIASRTVGSRAFLEHRAIHVEDMVEEFRNGNYLDGRALQEPIGYRTVLAMPLLREETAIGVILLRRMDVQPFADKQIALLKTFADQAAIAIENVRLFRELQARNRDLTEALEQQTATSEVLKVISRSAFDLEPVLQTLIENATRLCGARHGHILRFDGRFFHHAVSFGASTGFAEYFARHPSALDSGSAAGRAGLERRTVHIHDVLADAGYALKDLARAEGFRTLLAVPMLREGVLLGTINLWKTEVEPFTDRQIELVTTFADQAVIAIENVRLFGELQERTRELARSVEELQALGAVGRAVSSTLDLDNVLTTIVARALELSGADGGNISEYDEATQQFHIRTTSGVEEGLVELIRAAPIRFGEGTMGKAAATRAPVQVADILNERDYDVARIRDVMARLGYRSVLSVPLLREERIIGGLAVWRRAVGEFPPQVVNLLQTFATQSTLAIEHARLFRELEQKGRELALASRHKSEFLANMSHELRTPLNAVLGYTELILDGIYGEVPEKIRDVMTRIDRSGRHLLGLINDVLDLSKIEAGQLTLSLADYSMDEVVQTVVVALESVAAEKKLALTREVAADLPRGRGDDRRLGQVLLNLVGNALKFTDAGEVRVVAGVEDGHFHVAVADTGPGISAADQKRIFEAFQQVDSSLTRKKGGTGLGLSIARRIVELHGGRLWVESAPGNGSTFSFAVPVRVDRQVTP